MKISIYLENNSIANFFYSIDMNKMIYLLKEKFLLWDFLILKYFSEFKLFRQEVNKILCLKSSYGIKIKNCKEENKSNISNISNNNIINIRDNRIFNYKKKFNFNKINTKTRTLIQNENSLQFFFHKI